MSGGFGGVEEVLRRHRCRASRPGLTPIKINAVVERGINDHTVSISWSAFAAPA